MTAPAERRTAPRAAKQSRHHAREAAVQMLYQWEVGRASMDEVMETFWLHDAASTGDLSEDLRTFATDLARGVAARVDDLDPVISDAAEHWRLERMNVMDRLILRLAV